jgi:serine kinase of HPr protein (carbohydrate metabolism regulator)
MSAVVHAVAVAVAIDPDGPLAGALFLGGAGAGKSRLALNLIENCPWRRSALVADDAVILEQRRGALIARAPQRIAGLAELRGFGVVRLRMAAEAEISAAFDLEAGVERLPDPRRFEAAGGIAPLYPFRADAPAAAAALRVALRSISGGQS